MIRKVIIVVLVLGTVAATGPQPGGLADSNRMKGCLLPDGIVSGVVGS